MRKVELIKIEVPTSSDWGMLQVSNFPKSHYRFDIQGGKPVLDTNFFSDAEPDPDKKHKHLQKGSDFYNTIQQLLNDHYASLGDFKQEEESNTKRRELLEQLLFLVDEMKEAVDRLDRDKYARLEEEFNNLSVNLMTLKQDGTITIIDPDNEYKNG
jgi:predicted transcriptional regulator